MAWHPPAGLLGALVTVMAGCVDEPQPEDPWAPHPLGTPDPSEPVVDLLGEGPPVVAIERWLDLVVVVDERLEAAWARARLAGHMDTLVARLRGADVRARVAVAGATDTYERPAVRSVEGHFWVDVELQDADVLLADLITQRVSWDVPLDRLRLWDAVRGAYFLDGFARPLAASSGLVLTTDDDQDPTLDAADFAAGWVGSDRPPGGASLWALASPDPACPGAGAAAIEVAAAVAALGGELGSVCDADYTAVLSALVDATPPVALETLHLTRLPEPASLDLVVRIGEVGQMLDAEWIWDPEANAILVEAAWRERHPAGATLQVSYRTAW